MSRTRSVATPTPPTHPTGRRTVLAAAGAVALSGGISAALVRPAGGTTPGRARAEIPAHSRTAPRPGPEPFTHGTTLDSVATPGRTGPYRRLGDGPGWGRVLRQELGRGRPGRDTRRQVLSSFVQFTDLHLVDVQHPLRYEYLRAATASAWRPQEALSTVGALSLVERVNSLTGGPVTGSPLDCVVTTGDNTDNNALCELDWFLSLMSGGLVVPDTGEAGHFEGVQSSGLPLYWQPDDALRDGDKRVGFPRIEGYLAAATRAFTSPGLSLPWYSTVGNHDFLPGGCWAPGDGWATEYATGDRKLMELPGDRGGAFWRQVTRGEDPKGALFRELLRSEARHLRPVTPDPRRAPVTPEGYVRAHLEPGRTGPGPHGHGYTEENLDRATRYYRFPMADDVLGISLDTTDSGGHYEGSIGEAQFRWLERTVNSATQPYVLVFSHHTSKTMRNTRPDPARPGERRRDGAQVLALLERSPKVLAWINGHSHKNAVTAHRDLWEISTASHVDHPQLARVVELVDNRDGTLSLFTTLIESAAPHASDTTDLSAAGLGALYRELAFNAPGARTTLGGADIDRNTELIIAKPATR